MGLWKKIDEIMRLRKWNDSILAQNSGIPASTISSARNRNSDISYTMIVAFANAFGMTASQLVAEEGEAVVLTSLQERWLFVASLIGEDKAEKLIEVFTE